MKQWPVGLVLSFLAVSCLQIGALFLSQYSMSQQERFAEDKEDILFALAYKSAQVANAEAMHQTSVNSLSSSDLVDILYSDAASTERGQIRLVTTFALAAQSRRDQDIVAAKLYAAALYLNDPAQLAEFERRIDTFDLDIQEFANIASGFAEAEGDGFESVYSNVRDAASQDLTALREKFSDITDRQDLNRFSSALIQIIVGVSSAFAILITGFFSFRNIVRGTST